MGNIYLARDLNHGRLVVAASATPSFLRPMSANGAIAAIVAMPGLFSVLAYYVAEREREFAIRMALGARALQILNSIAHQGAAVTTGGVLLGVGVVTFASRWIEPLLYHSTPVVRASSGARRPRECDARELTRGTNDGLRRTVPQVRVFALSE